MNDEKRLRLFRVDCQGAIYWILGQQGTVAEMVAAIEHVEGVTFEQEAWERPTVDDVREVAAEEARGLVCKTEGEPDVDMWTAAEEHRRVGHGRVVACSEWP